MPTREGAIITPGNQGGTNFYSPSFSPRTGLFYIPTWAEYASSFTKFPITYQAGQRYTGGAPRNPGGAGGRGGGGMISTPGEDDSYGAVRAIDPRTGERKWEFKMTGVTTSGLLTTASDLLFTGGRDGYFFALDATNGALLWKATIGGRVVSGPMTYAVGGRQYVAVAAGNGLFVYALRQ